MYSIFKLLKNGCPSRLISNNCRSLDIIEFFPKTVPRIIEIVAPLHNEGMSITDIEQQTGIKRTSIWKALKAQDQSLPSNQAILYARWRKGHKRTGARPPYGFCFLQGELVRDPKEYPTLLLIHSLWTRGSDIVSILSALGDRGLKSRTGKEWSYGVIKSIAQRIESGAIVLESGKLMLSESFLKGISSSSKASTKKRKG